MSPTQNEMVWIYQNETFQLTKTNFFYIVSWTKLKMLGFFCSDSGWNFWEISECFVEHKIHFSNQMRERMNYTGQTLLMSLNALLEGVQILLLGGGDKNLHRLEQNL